MTIHINYAQASRDLAKLMGRVADDREIVIIDRPGSEGVALVAADELSGLLETAHLLRSPRNAERLLAALSRARDGTVAPQSVRQLREKSGLGRKKKAEAPEKPERLAVFHQEFRENLRFWVETDRKVALRAFDLVESTLKDPFEGIGKPEPLKYLAQGTWSHCLTQERRIIYLASDVRINFLQSRFHYGKAIERA